MKSSRSILYAISFVFVIAFVAIYAAKKTTVLNSNPANAVNSNSLTETDQPSDKTPEKTPPDYNTNSSTQPNAINPNTGRPENNSEAARIQQIELEKTKELNEKNVQMIREQMKKEEITSLQNSILNDEKLLKEIEAQGTGANDYKYIETNLKKRRARLKELTQK